MEPIKRLTPEQAELVRARSNRIAADQRTLRELLQMAAPEGPSRFDYDTMAFYAVEQEDADDS